MPEKQKKIFEKFNKLRDSEYKTAVDQMTVGPGEDPIMKVTRAAMRTREAAFAKIGEKYKLSEKELNAILSDGNK